MITNLLFGDMNQKRYENRPLVSHSPKVVGAARNAFGTRLCQRIECSRCHRVDHVSLRIAGAKTKYCRACAEKLLETYEAGRLVAAKLLKRSCNQCRVEFEVSESIALKKDELMCKDCYRGFEVWRGKASEAKNTKDSSYLIKKNGTTTILRKTVNDTI